jgi:type II secretory pathway pseudopilin PulG
MLKTVYYNHSVKIMKTRPTQSNQAGFSTLELILLTVIICILSGLIYATHNSIDAKQDNTQRQNDINSLRREMETYYSQYNKYPTLADVNNPTWRATYMANLDKEALRDPDSSSYLLAAKPGKNVYSYAVASTAGKPCDDVKTICTQYTLTATLAGGGTYVENNLE